jgi:hypothetical protein
MVVGAPRSYSESFDLGLQTPSILAGIYLEFLGGGVPDLDFHGGHLPADPLSGGQISILPGSLPSPGL